MTNKANYNRQSFINYMLESDELAYSGFQMLVKERPDFADYFDDLATAGLFDARHNKGPVAVPGKDNFFQIPYWGALSYLEAVAKQAGEKNSTDLAAKVLKVVRDVSNARVDGKPVDNFYTARIFAEILAVVPTVSVTEAEIDLIPVWVAGDFDHGTAGHVLANQLLPRFLASENPSDWDKAVRILRHSLELHPDSKRSRLEGEPVSAIGDHWLEELLKQNTEALGKRCGGKAAIVFQKRLREVFSIIEAKVSSWSARPAIEDHSQNYDWRGTVNCLVEGLRDTVTDWLSTEPKEARQFVAELLKSRDFEIERRIGIHLVNTRFDILKDLVPLAIPLLADNGHLHEMYELLQARFPEFDQVQQKRVLDAINNLPKRKKDESGIVRLRTQRNWLSAIRGKGNVEADKLFDELNKDDRLGGISPHPNFISWMETWWGPGPSTYQVPELLSFLEDGSLIEKLNAFKEADGGRWSDTPTVKALVDALEEAIVKEPSKFVQALPQFQQVDRPYQYGVINSFKKIWDAATPQDAGAQWEGIWPPLLSLIESLILSDAFWSEPPAEDRDLTPTKAWIPSIIADFLRAAVKKDEKSISPQFLPRVWILLRKLLEKAESDWRHNEPDSMTQAINTEKGRVIEALVDYALFCARKSDRERQEHDTTWKEMEPVFTAQLSLCKDANYEFSTLMGAYFANLEYLSKQWVEKRLKQIFPTEYNTNFLCAIRGLAYAPASKNGYIMLKDAGIILAALGKELSGRHARENLLQRVALAYMQGEEALDSPTMRTLFKSDNEEDIAEIAEFFWRVRGQDLEDIHRQRVLGFWKECMAWSQGQKTRPTKALSMAALLIGYLDNITADQKGWLIASAPYVAKHHLADYFIEELGRLAEVNPAAVKDIFSAMLSSYLPYGDYDGKISSMIRKVADAGYRTEAKLMCDRLRNIAGFQALYEELDSAH